MKTDISEYDLIFMSFDEPNAEQNWADLVSKCPWAQRSHGVKGLDEAHKAAANMAQTERFILVDGDCIVDETFFDQKLDLSVPKFERTTLSWASKNHINGLVYGNGGVKLWWRQNVLDMKTHENAELEEEKVDFCWHQRYIQMHNCYGTTYTNSTPYQAWRAGFREGVKMSLDQGIKVNPEKFESSIWPVNYKRLLILASVGADVENGNWAILGTRMGMEMTNLTDWDFSLISDYTWIEDFFSNEVYPKFNNENNMDNELFRLGDLLRRKLRVQLAELDAIQSKFFKSVNLNLERRGSMALEGE